MKPAEKSPTLVALMSAMEASEAFFRAKIAYSLSQHPGMANVPDGMLLRRLRPVLGEAELKTVSAHLAARAAAASVMETAEYLHRNAVKVVTMRALAEFATPLENGFFEFRDRYKGTVRAQALSFDACYCTPDGIVCGSVRVSPCGTGSSEPWSFRIENGRMLVTSDPVDF